MSNHFKFISQENTRQDQYLFKAPGIMITQSRTWHDMHPTTPGQESKGSPWPHIQQALQWLKALMFDPKSSCLSTQIWKKALQKHRAAAQELLQRSLQSLTEPYPPLYPSSSMERLLQGRHVPSTSATGEHYTAGTAKEQTIIRN